jgi:hypothetical protein
MLKGYKMFGSILTEQIRRRSVTGVKAGEVEFGGPATYRIEVRGRLTADWQDRLAGMTVTPIREGPGEYMTELRGLLRDQAELSGVLDTLYHLHLPILRLEQIDDSPEQDQ